MFLNNRVVIFRYFKTNKNYSLMKLIRPYMERSTTHFVLVSSTSKQVGFSINLFISYLLGSAIFASMFIIHSPSFGLKTTYFQGTAIVQVDQFLDLVSSLLITYSSQQPLIHFELVKIMFVCGVISSIPIKRNFQQDRELAEHT